MATLLFKLRNVPDDEAEEIRDVLQNNNIDFYETNAGSWGISLPAIWLHSNEQFEQGKRLIAEYQQQRSKQAQSAHAEQCKHGTQRTILTLMMESPIKWFAYILAILFVLYLTTIPVSFLFS